MTKSHIWYIRRGDAVKGPFPAGQISQYLVLGRVFPTDEVSHDKEKWMPLRSVPELIPDVLRGQPEDDIAEERLRAARRWADERSTAEQPSYEGSERRHSAASDHPRVSDGLDKVSAGRRRSKRFAQVFAVLAIIVGVVYVGFNLPTSNLVSVAQCDAKPSPGVNWSNCRLSGMQVLNTDMHGALLNSTFLNGARFTGSNLTEADLSYADLSNGSLAFVDFTRAKLTGTSLRSADLSQADFTDADLSYADLSKAKLTGAQFKGAQLDHTVWKDGTTCKPGSVGRCMR